MKKKQTKYCYSWNGEDFKSDTFDSVQEALADAAVENDGEYFLVYVGEASRPSNSMFFPDAHVLIEKMYEQAGDYAGEHASDYPDASTEAVDDLTAQLHKLLSNWCEKHGIGPAFYQVSSVKEHTIPAKTE